MFESALRPQPHPAPLTPFQRFGRFFWFTAIATVNIGYSRKWHRFYQTNHPLAQSAIVFAVLVALVWAYGLSAYISSHRGLARRSDRVINLLNVTLCLTWLLLTIWNFWTIEPFLKGDAMNTRGQFVQAAGAVAAGRYTSSPLAATASWRFVRLRQVLTG